MSTHNALPGRLVAMPASPFTRLRELIGTTPPGGPVGEEPINLTIGEPRDKPPAFVLDILRKEATGFGRYPPIDGTRAFREACVAWLARRYKLPPGALDVQTQILPLNGSREGLFYAPFALMPETKEGGRAVILLPNPFYATYPTAALATGAEPYYVAARPETGFLPDFASVPEAVLKHTVAAYICSPSNPEGACADKAYWTRLFALADAHDFTVLADECYTEIYDAVAPTGALSVRLAERADCGRLLSFHSLSKRSNLPGLRSGFVAGPADIIERLKGFRNTAAPQMPYPTLAGSAAAWADDAHVEATRARYRARFEVAARLFGNAKGFRLPGGGFYLYLDVGDGPAFALEHWKRDGVRVLPAAFMGVGEKGQNPGFAYVRVALVHDLSTITAALERMAVRLRNWDGV